MKHAYHKHKTAFTLVELLIYISIFVVVSGVLVGILYSVVRSSEHERASAEVVQQLRFVQTTVQRLVQESSLIQNPVGVPASTLTLRMKDSAKDPTVISSDANFIYLRQGTGPVSKLTSDRVVIDQFQATRRESPGGLAIVELNMTFTYNTPSPYRRVTRVLETGVARASAPTFDYNLIPGADNTFDVGSLPNLRWRQGNFTRLELSRAGANPTLVFDTDSADRFVFGVDYGDANKFKIETGGALGGLSPAMTIDSLGRVGIGTPSPTRILGLGGTAARNIGMERGIAAGAAGFALTVNAGGATIGATNMAGGDLILASGISTGTGTSNIHFQTATPGAAGTADNLPSTKLTILGNGNVGIGTTSPGAMRLSVLGASLFNNPGAGFQRVLNVNNSVTAAADTGPVIVMSGAGVSDMAELRAGWDTGAISNAYLAFRTMGGNVMGEHVRIDSTGNVGIGTTAPTQRLHVIGNIIKTGTVSFVQDHPKDPKKEIVYVSLEGGEAGTYTRGKGQLINGKAKIDLPEHFKLVTVDKTGLTAQITALDDCNGLMVVKLSNSTLVVKELNNGKSNARFYYMVNGIRKGYEGYEPIRPKISENHLQ